MKTVKSIQKIKIWICMALFLLLLMAYGSRVMAETTTSVITNLPSQQDLTVHFTFDVGKVDIVFISPAGERKSKGDEDVEFAEGGVSQPLWVRYLPLLIALAGSLAWTFYSIVFLKKPKMKKGRIIGNLLLWDGVVAAYEGIIGWLYFRKYSFGRSLDFFELAERSGAEAAKEMSEEAMLFQALLIGAGVLVLSILVTVLVIILKKRKDKKKNAEKTED